MVQKRLRIRNARIFLFGNVVSTLGDSSLWFAMGIWMKELTGSSAWAGLVFFAYIAGNLFSPLGGVLADRFPRQALLVTANYRTAYQIVGIAVCKASRDGIRGIDLTPARHPGCRRRVQRQPSRPRR